MSALMSHPDKTLAEHTAGVMDIARKLAEYSCDSDNLKSLIEIMAFAHDVGKSTGYFQKYLAGDKSLKNKDTTNHAKFGGIVSLYLTKQNFQNNDLFFEILALLLPAKHHSDLENFKKSIDNFYENHEETFEKQIKSINKNDFEDFLKQFPDKFHFDLTKLPTPVETRKYRKFLRKIIKNESLEYYINAILCFSILIDADKSDAGIKNGKNYIFAEHNISEQIVKTFVDNIKPKKTNTIMQLRSDAFNKILSVDIDLNKKIYALNLPTGAGKTLTSYAFAFKLADKIKREKGINLKIIYSLPFLSIIEQNHSVLEKVLGTDSKPDSSLLLKHHHLSDVTYKTEENKPDDDSSQILTEGWNSKIIVTTFVQFFHTILGYKNKSLRKFNKLTNSVVILDEIQSIPHKYWLVFEKLLNEMTKRFNFYVILSTATQPMIFDDPKPVSLIKNHEDYFSRLNRYKIKVHKDEKTLEEFFDSLELDNNKSYLFIMNTIKEALDFYNMFPEDQKEDIIFLTTRIIPKDRLNKIQKLKEGKHKIAITTQIVEAGVDIDFDVVYRDFAPLDSLIQAAGRCNRENKKKQGVINIVKLKDQNGKSFRKHIYETLLLYCTEETLTKDEYQETEVLQLVENYYNLIKIKKSDKDSLDLLKCLYELKFKGAKETGKINSVADFKLIEESKVKDDVFIEADEQAKKIWDDFSEIIKTEDIFEQKKAFRKIKADFYNYVISVPTEKNPPPLINGIYYVPKSNLDDYYDFNTGFKTEEISHWEF